MSLRSKFLQGGMVLAVGQVLSQGMSVARNILVASLIDTESDFGIASTLIMVVAFNELLTNIGMNTLVIQDREGDQPHFLDSTHFLAFVRGVVGALSLLVLAYPLAVVFGIPQAAWAFAVLAVIPLLRGVAHYDVYRMQRAHSFLPGVLQDILGQFIALAVSVPFLRFFHGYSAVLSILILQTFFSTVLSHLFAKLPYRWVRDQVIERRVMAFGFPLMLNGILFFLNSQGERIAIGSSGQFFSTAKYNMEDMAAVSAALMIAGLAPQFLARILGSLFMPLLSHGSEDRFISHSVICMHLHALTSGLVSIPLILFSDKIIAFVYGQRYLAAGSIIVFAAFSQALLAFRCGVNVSLLSRGHTWDAFVNSNWRAATVPMTILVACMGFDIKWIAVPAVVGEFIALSVLARQVCVRCSIPQSETLFSLALLVVGLGFAVSVRLLNGSQADSVAYFVSAAAILIGFTAAWATRLPAISGFLLHSIPPNLRNAQERVT